MNRQLNRITLRHIILVGSAMSMSMSMSMSMMNTKSTIRLFHANSQMNIFSKPTRGQNAIFQRVSGRTFGSSPQRTTTIMLSRSRFNAFQVPSSSSLLSSSLLSSLLSSSSSSSNRSNSFYSRERLLSCENHNRCSFSTQLSATTNTNHQQPNNNKQTQTKKKINNQKKKNNNKNINTGGLRRLPVVKAPIEIINRAVKICKRDCRADTTIKNARNRARKHATITLDTLTKELCIPLRDVVNGYKYEISNLHAFENVVADLTVKARQKKDGVSLLHLLNDIHECRKEILSCGKDWVAKAKYAETAKEAMDAMVQGEKALVELFQTLVGGPLVLLIDLQKALRTTPAVRLDTPAVVLVGAPNVGKSSIVRAISSATPEVNNYPFTTRGMTLGHVQVFWKDQTTTAAAVIPEVDEKQKGRFQVDNNKSGLSGSYAFTQLCQVMDSPGLLVRDSDDQRNEMESLTLAAMQHLPTAVMYVLDLSGGAGDKCSSVEDQIQLRREVRARFPRRPWIDVVSKYDLGLVDGARDQLEEVLDGAPYIELSIKEGTGVDELRDEVMRMLGEVRVVLDAMAAVDTRSARPT